MVCLMQINRLTKKQVKERSDFMKELKTININQTDISVKEYQGKRVVTLKDIDLCHKRPDGTARKRFNDNKQHFIEGEDFFVSNQPSEIRTLGITRPQGGVPKSVTLITESGYLMLVKSFTDDLSWQVQRQLVNTYFKVGKQKSEDTLKIQIQQERSKAMLLNAQYRMLKLLMANPDLQKLSPVAVETLGIKAVESVTGADLGNYLPKVEKTYSATEVGNALGISAQKVGKIANAHNLKTEEYGVFVMDKSRYNSKEVTNFRYNEKGKAKIRELMHSA